ncbi:MAG: FMN-binding negative transcriptional regulator [Leptolyngbyaceae cyanobacterium SM1_3_5]|nr:FMN-binding negative transcriptional regulator [Leptolyngbyaceae cyanobacterium SM1_3_5]
MYIPPAFREEDVEQLVAFMQANSFATLVSIRDGVPCASHVPLVVLRQENEIKLIGHLAKANLQWRSFDAAESLAIFTGAHAYISPALYEQQENVPTWNYIAVHAYGKPEVITLSRSRQLMETLMDKMIDTYESAFKSHWHNFSDGYRTSMMNGIVAFEMTITRLEGKYKLSQNRTQTDQQNVANSLSESDDPAARSIALEMQKNLDK